MRFRIDSGGLRRGATGLLLAALVAACGAEGPAVPARVTLSPDRTLLTSIGEALRFEARVRDEAGQRMSGVTLEWTSSDPGVATVDASGLAVAVAPGTTTITAEVGGVRGSASLEVYVPPRRTTYEAGRSYWSRNEYARYIPGDLPLVISAPHGGGLRPDEIDDRSYGVTGTDRNTAELALAVREAIIQRTGLAPHLIISQLARIKLDPNREIVEAAQGNPFAENAWREYHGFIEDAKTAVTDRYGSGLYLDIHGHGHEIERIELGYLLTASDLARDDGELDGSAFVDKSSVRVLAITTGLPLSTLVRGPRSLGGILQGLGFRSVPSPADPDPGGAPYFSGGYSTARHGSRDGGRISGIQLEHQYPGLRDTDDNRRFYAARLAEAVERFMLEHYGFYAPAEILEAAGS